MITGCCLVAAGCWLLAAGCIYIYERERERESIQNAIGTVEALGHDMRKKQQGHISKFIMGAQIDFDFTIVSLTRITKRFGMTEVDLAANALPALKYIANIFKPCIRSDAIVTSLNGWCTRRRFGRTWAAYFVNPLSVASNT